MVVRFDIRPMALLQLKSATQQATKVITEAGQIKLNIWYEKSINRRFSFFLCIYGAIAGDAAESTMGHYYGASAKMLDM